MREGRSEGGREEQRQVGSEGAREEGREEWREGGEGERVEGKTGNWVSDSWRKTLEDVMFYSLYSRIRGTVAIEYFCCFIPQLLSVYS